jgi:cell division septal protein FtsQ
MLPTLFGTEERLVEIFNIYTQAQNVLNSLDVKINKIIMQPHQYWELQLENGTILYLKESQALNQLEFLVKIYAKLTHERENHPKSIDLRYADGLAVKWE